MNGTARFGLVVGPVLFGVLLLAPMPEGLAGPGQRALAVMALCVTWWLTTPIAMPVTSLLGMALLPLLGALGKNEAMALFGNQAVFFVIAAFVIAAVTVRTGLSTRIALWALRRTARSEDVVCASVLAVAAGLTAIVVSHAVAALLLPIMMEILRALHVEPGSRFARRVLLSMAWGTICGSNLTLLSSARASLALGMYATEAERLRELPIGFFEFSSATAPVALATLIAAFVLLRWYHRPEGLDMAPALQRLEAHAVDLGRVKRSEWLTAAVVLAMVGALVALGPTYGLGTVALVFVALLFLLQVARWEDAESFVNWGVALLYGGAIAIGEALHQTGAVHFLVGAALPDGGLSPVAGLAFGALAAAILTEFVSNAAVIALLLPMGVAMAPEVGLEPRAIPLLFSAAAGLAFALPMSTPAMAMVFGTGYLRPQDSAVPGVLVTTVGLTSLVLLATFGWPFFGIDVFRE